jgi:hypothetical protein
MKNCRNIPEEAFSERRRLAVVAWNEGALGAPALFRAWSVIRVLAAQRRVNRETENRTQ